MVCGFGSFVSCLLALAFLASSLSGATTFPRLYTPSNPHLTPRTQAHAQAHRHSLVLSFASCTWALCLAPLRSTSLTSCPPSSPRQSFLRPSLPSWPLSLRAHRRTRVPPLPCPLSTGVTAALTHMALQEVWLPCPVPSHPLIAHQAMPSSAASSHTSPARPTLTLSPPSPSPSPTITATTRAMPRECKPSTKMREVQALED